jgi:hypothetical protein
MSMNGGTLNNTAHNYKVTYLRSVIGTIMRVPFEFKRRENFAASAELSLAVSAERALLGGGTYSG